MSTIRLHSRSVRKQARPGPIPNWCTLAKADEVEIQQHGQTIATGRIDMLAVDGSMLWILKDAGNGRALFLHSDGVAVYRRSQKSIGRC